MYSGLHYLSSICIQWGGGESSLILALTQCYRRSNGTQFSHNPSRVGVGLADTTALGSTSTLTIVDPKVNEQSFQMDSDPGHLENCISMLERYIDSLSEGVL